MVESFSISMIDSHCHLNCLNLAKYDGKLEGALEAAKANGVEGFLCVCIDLEHFPEVLNIAKQYRNVKASVGLHPNEKEGEEPSVARLVNLASDPDVVAIGETGLDYYRTEGEISWQQERFRCHIQAAKQVHKPLIIHSRQAPQDTIRILQEERAEEVGGVMHCFTENLSMAEEAIALGFYISFSGIVTFKNAKSIQEVAKQLPLDKILIETDSPYLTPDPYRSQPNEPAYVRYVAEKIAELKKIELHEVILTTTNNYKKLFINTISETI